MNRLDGSDGMLSIRKGDGGVNAYARPWQEKVRRSLCTSETDQLSADIEVSAWDSIWVRLLNRAVWYVTLVEELDE